MTPPLSGDVDVAVVYGDGDRATADATAAAFGTGVRANAVNLRPVVITTGQAGASAARVFLLAPSALPAAATIATALAGKGGITVSTDVAAVESGRVVMAVRSEPRVEIFVSRAAAAATGVTFASAFRMMIQER